MAMMQHGLRLVMVIAVLGFGLGAVADEMPPRPSGTPTWEPAKPGATPEPTPAPDPRYLAAQELGRELAAVDEALWEVFDARRADGEAVLFEALDEHLEGSRERVKDAVRGFEIMQCRRDGQSQKASLHISDPAMRQSFLQGYMPAVTRFRAVRSEVQGDPDSRALFEAAKARQTGFQDQVCTELEAEPERRIIAAPKLGTRAGSKSSSS
jgi:hypothetical protein